MSLMTNVFYFHRGHVEDVYDLSWSADSRHLISGSVDNTAIVWNTHTGTIKYIIFVT